MYLIKRRCVYLYALFVYFQEMSSVLPHPCSHHFLLTDAIVAFSGGFLVLIFVCMFCIFCVIWNWSTIHSSRQLEDDLRSLEAQISIYNASFIEERKERNKLFGVGGVCADADDHFNNNNNNSKKKKRRWKTA